MSYIDIRSDTVTKPSKAMLEAMMNACVGDDVFSEDESVNELQRKCAEITGKEDALFVTSGVMGNQLAIKCHTVPGDEVIVESESHILNYETAAPSVISNVQLLPVQGNSGILYSEDIKKYIRSKEYYFPVTKLICLENTHNRAGGVILPLESIRDISEFAKKNGIKTHLDGARIFNAYAETKISVKDYSEHFDSVSFCFSKGLGCPVGSVLCGNRGFIEMARKWRKILGGGMRQSGFLAAAAIYALDNNVERLKEDNDKAKYFGTEISRISGIQIDLKSLQTNIVIFSSSKYPKEVIMNNLREKGILISSGSYDNLRAVFHLDVTSADVEKAVETMKSI
ncbi:MAG: aminotransferase class I/II-fold pyridoxal phosphate-dependent enzyme [Bacteroidetes bacterium]|nr:aminotransferase class I/II-fold pyridoxal phosphate-dependent enzyme [Bacteroidota bacterium]